MKTLKEIVMYIWQLPQHLLGLILISLYKKEKKFKYNTSVVRVCPNFRSGISLGRYIIIKRNKEDVVKHEWGHAIQSKWWGPLYLLVPGLCSLLHNMFGKYRWDPHTSYYDYWVEKQADKLGGVVR